MKLPVAILLVLYVSFAALAQDAADVSEQDEAGRPTPDVTIIQGSDKTVAEYRIHGRLYMIKVTPRKGVPYYLVDTDGDGNLETNRSELTEDLLIPSWTLLKWK